jgi:hypothetical protein
MVELIVGAEVGGLRLEGIRYRAGFWVEEVVSGGWVGQALVVEEWGHRSEWQRHDGTGKGDVSGRSHSERLRTRQWICSL